MSSPSKRSAVKVVDRGNPQAPPAPGSSKTPLPPLVNYTQPREKFALHYKTLSMFKSFRNISKHCRVPSKIKLVLPKPNQPLEKICSASLCVYEIYFISCGLFFPLLDVFLLYLHHLGMAFPQMAPNMLRTILCTLKVAAETGFSLSNQDLLELFNVLSSKQGYFTIYPVSDRNLITGLLEKDENWSKYWFLGRVTPPLLMDWLICCNMAGQARLVDFIILFLIIVWIYIDLSYTCYFFLFAATQVQSAPRQGFLDFYRLVTKGDVIWNSLTLD